MTTEKKNEGWWKLVGVVGAIWFLMFAVQSCSSPSGGPDNTCVGTHGFEEPC